MDGPNQGRPMTENPKTEQSQGPERPEPIFNLPGAVLALCAAMVAVHLAKTFVLNEQGQLNLLIWFAFVPFRIMDASGSDGGLWPLLWTPVTHAFLHGGWEHLIFNTLWLAIFGTPVARRYGNAPFFTIFLASAIVGALAYAAYSLGTGQLGFLLGASGGVAGLTGAAVRFMFQPVIVTRHPDTGEVIPLGRRLASLGDLVANPQPRYFILIWVILNALVPLLPLGNAAIAWHAHLGGFFTGLLIVPLFERRQP
jgi:membrane associated rhomboid family serine protease